MALAAIFRKTYAVNEVWGVQPPFTSLTPTKAVSPAAGVGVTANTGELGVGAYVTASVLGTGVNSDALTQGVEAV